MLILFFNVNDNYNTYKMFWPLVILVNMVIYC